MAWLDNEQAKKSYLKHLNSIKKQNKEEREKLAKIKDFEKGQKVQILYKNVIYNEVILRVNQKSYTVSFLNDGIVNLHKETLSGFPKYIIDEKTGDGRRYIGENVKLLKEINLN
jgi:hypothetical protein